jgi:UDP-N-acetylmuramoyl-L-alanyl-D-glutamate--2,6-diaminopimelate ligase
MARAGSDHLILTTSGFRGEPPLWSLQGHLQGARTVGGAEVAVVLDRRRAIERALREAVPGDAVVVLGRGAFSALTADARGVAIPFDDRVVVGEILRGL